MFLVVEIPHQRKPVAWIADDESDFIVRCARAADKSNAHWFVSDSSGSVEWFDLSGSHMTAPRDDAPSEFDYWREWLGHDLHASFVGELEVEDFLDDLESWFEGLGHQPIAAQFRVRAALLDAYRPGTRQYEQNGLEQFCAGQFDIDAKALYPASNHFPHGDDAEAIEHEKIQVTVRYRDETDSKIVTFEDWESCSMDVLDDLRFASFIPREWFDEIIDRAALWIQTCYDIRNNEKAKESA